MLFSVDLRVRSNMKRIATASLQTRGSMLTNSRCPPRSHIEKVISVLRIEMVFSMKLTPERCQWKREGSVSVLYTKCLNVVFVPTPLDILDHETRLAYLSIPHHADFDDHTALTRLLCLSSSILIL
jgi:hypothetical protein